MEERIQVIRISPDAKQLIIFEFPEHVSIMDVRKQSQELTDKLWKWWNSDEPFGVIGLESGFKIKVERIESNS